MPKRSSETVYRRSLRLQGYDYAQAGAYFVTICTQNRACLFGEVADGTTRLNPAGQLAATPWNDMPLRFPETDMDAFVVMPNHVHGIIVLPDRAAVVGAPLVGAPTRTGRPRGPPLRSVMWLAHSNHYSPSNTFKA
jgi:putative transposase